jgi:hypothetical protein
MFSRDKISAAAMSKQAINKTCHNISKAHTHTWCCRAGIKTIFMFPFDTLALSFESGLKLIYMHAWCGVCGFRDWRLVIRRCFWWFFLVQSFDWLDLEFFEDFLLEHFDNAWGFIGFSLSCDLKIVNFKINKK